MLRAEMVRQQKSESEKQPNRPRRRIVRIAYWGAVACIWLTIFGVFAFVWIAHDLPDLSDLPPPGGEAIIRIEAASGATIARYGPIYGDWLEYADLPEPMVLALLAIEDRRFFRHGAVDPFGILRAVVTNIRHGGLRAGGSTLTQQLAKNLFLSSERSLKRKAQELLMAIWLERQFSKQQILTLYLNRVYFGAGTYGIDAASRTFFGHEARRLDLSEAAMLAGLVKAPSRLAPIVHYEAALARSRVVLDAMVDTGFITREAADRARTRPPKLAADAAGPDIRYFTDWARAEADRLSGAGNRPLIIRTTLDLTAQSAAERVIDSRLAGEGGEREAGQAALIALSPEGAILAMMGGRSYGESQYNRVTQARRQPGSAFKPILYLAGFEAGLRPDMVYVDGPVDIEGWQPRNFNGRYAGEMTLHDAFARSVNTIAVKVAQFAGIGRVIDTARRLGVRSPLQPVPSLALGASGLTLLELGVVYAEICNGGLRADPYAIVEIRTPKGEVLYRYRPDEPERLIDADDARALGRMMEAVIREGTGKAAKIDRPAAGKTGTSQDHRDALFVGCSGDLVAGVWVGNDDERPMTSVSGGGLPARIWSDFMIDAHIGRPPRPLLFEDAAQSSSRGGP